MTSLVPVIVAPERIYATETLTIPCGASSHVPHSETTLGDEACGGTRIQYIVTTDPESDARSQFVLCTRCDYRPFV